MQSSALRLIAIVHSITGALPLMGFVCLVALYILAYTYGTHSTDPSETLSQTSTTLILLGILLILLLSVGFVLSGVCIQKHRMRWLSILVSFVYLPFFPIGTVIGGLCLWGLTSPVTKSLYEA